MEITQVTTINLEDSERDALETLKSAYIQCLSMNCFDCEECPLYAHEGCIGWSADHILDKLKRR